VRYIKNMRRRRLSSRMLRQQAPVVRRSEHDGSREIPAAVVDAVHLDHQIDGSNAMKSKRFYRKIRSACARCHSRPGSPQRAAAGSSLTAEHRAGGPVSAQVTSWLASSHVACGRAIDPRTAVYEDRPLSLALTLAG
jgi:hypothetical protein